MTEMGSNAWKGKLAKVTYDDAGATRVLRGTVTNVYGFIEMELPDGHMFAVNMAKVARLLEIDDTKRSGPRSDVTVIE